MSFPKLNVSARYSALAILIAISTGTCAATPAGTSILAYSNAIYQNTAGATMPTATSNTVTVTVGDAASVDIAASNVALKLQPGQTVDSTMTVTNTGNNQSSFNLSAAGTPSEWTVKLVADTNSDGTRQSTETTEITSTDNMAPGSTYKFFAVVSAPSTAQPGMTANVTIAATASSDSTITDSTQITAAIVAVSPYITTWLINGYYPNSDKAGRLGQDYIGNEAYLAPWAGDSDGGHTWKEYSSVTDKVDFLLAFGTQTNCVAYAFTYVYSPIDQSGEMRVGSDDGVQVSVNGDLIWNNNVYRGYTVDQDKFPVSLNAGWNKLLVKLSQGSGNWGFSAKICNSSGQSLSGVTTSLATPDVTSPILSDAAVFSIGQDSATIVWTTDEPGTTQAEYPSGSATAWAGYPELVKEHFLVLTKLTPGTAYAVKLYSWDASGNGGQQSISFNTPSQSLVTDWVLNGYYSNSDRTTRLSTDYLGGESAVRPSFGEYTAGKQWVLPSIDAALGRVEFHPIYNMPSNCAGYAHTYVFSPTAQQGQLWMGSDDGLKVWVNGAQVWVNDTYRSCTADRDKFPITLNEGWNSVLVKVSNGSKTWRFTARFCDSSGNKLPGLSYSIVRP